MISLLLLAIGCSQPSLVAPDDECNPAVPEPGEVRARRIECKEDIPEYGEANIGDWLLENASIRLVIRNTPNRMTQLTGAGGTIIDAALWGGSDAVTEVVPHVDGGWPEALTIETDADGIALTAQDGSDRQYRYVLLPDSSQLYLEGSTGFTVVPAPGAKRRGNWLSAGDLYITAMPDVIDEGGWVHWMDTDRLFMGTQEWVVQERYADIVQASGQSNGTHIDVALDGVTQYRMAVDNGFFNGEVPTGAQLRARRSGHETSAWTDPATELVLDVGDAGFLSVEITDEESTPIPATLTWNGTSYALADEPTSVPVGPGIGTGQINAGPEFEIAIIDEINVQDEVSVSASMTRIASKAAWVDFDVRAFPDSTVRRTASSLKIKLAAQGIDYAVFNAVDEVSQTGGTSRVDHLISVSSSSRSGGPHGGLLAWPWSADSDKAAHGASNWDDMGPIDLLALMSRSGRRYTSVDATWLNAAGPAVNWDPIPDVIQVNGLDDIPALARVWDQRVAATVVGSRTWVDVPGRTATEILRGILSGRTTASTGPQLHLTVDDLQPGDTFDIAAERLVVIDIENPGDLTEVSIIGPGGELIHTWSISELPAETTVSHSGWICASATGISDWAITSPVWLDRP